MTDQLQSRPTTRVDRRRRLPVVLRHYANDFERREDLTAPDSDLVSTLRLAADEIEQYRAVLPPMDLVDR